MMCTPDPTLTKILETTDIVAVIKQYVELEEHSNGNYRGKCPFHESEEDKFTVSSTKQLFYCFTCNTSGNVIRFLLLMKSAENYAEVIAELQRFGEHHEQRPQTPD